MSGYLIFGKFGHSDIPAENIQFFIIINDLGVVLPKIFHRTVFHNH